MGRWLVTGCLVGVLAAAASAQSFVNWEAPQVHPLDQTPSGRFVLAVNTADERLEVFEVDGTELRPAGAIPVGLAPVSVRTLDDRVAWVVNHLSDSVSVVDLGSRQVVDTIRVGDEPADVVFAGDPRRAFVSISQQNEVWVLDPANPRSAPQVIPLVGEEPRALATDGRRVYAAIFESGNATTVLPQSVVSSALSPYAGQPNPPPNSGAGFQPPLAPGLPAPPAVGLVVRRDAMGRWMDDNGGDWSAAVTWDLADHDLAVIDANQGTVSYVSGLMTTNMALAVRGDGQVSVVGTEAFNEVRFEPNLAGRFLEVRLALVDPDVPGAVQTIDLNPQVAGVRDRVPQPWRNRALGDPRGVVWSADGRRGWITGLGSNNLVVVDAAGQRTGRVELPAGPTGVVHDAARGLVYVLCRFQGCVVAVDARAGWIVSEARFYDPTPAWIEHGRPLLYDTHEFSAYGQVSCASCHLDGRQDALVWDLGDPGGAVKPFNQVCRSGFGFCQDWHPMKGPMATQTLAGLDGTEPLHWRGDREDVAAFDVGYTDLLGDDLRPSAAEMQRLQDFLASIQPPPNPHRDLEDRLPPAFPNGGDPASGQFLFEQPLLDRNISTCLACHAPPAGTVAEVIPGPFLLETQGLKVPQLRNLYEKTGFHKDSLQASRGFGFTKDGSFDTVAAFLKFPGFLFTPGPAGDQERLDVEAFLMCFPTGTHPAVGQQTTVIDFGGASMAQRDWLADVKDLSDRKVVGLIVKGRPGRESRGYVHRAGDWFQSDRAAQSIRFDRLLARARPGHELTFTVVFRGTEDRLGIDRDEDGALDQDERDAGTDPADPDDRPRPVGRRGYQPTR